MAPTRRIPRPRLISIPLPRRWVFEAGMLVHESGTFQLVFEAGMLVHESGTFQLELDDIDDATLGEAARLASDIADLFAWLKHERAVRAQGEG